MKSALLFIATFFGSLALAGAIVKVDDEAFGKTLGGWKNRSNKAAEYDLSGATYRTYKPEVSPTPDGGLFISVRIDHVRGWLSSDDHAMLELTVDSKGMIVSAQSNIAIQGRSISSDLILGTNDAAHQAVGMDRAVQIGTDLVANLSAKLLREKIVEAGRVSFPAAVRHNYNLLFQAIRVIEIPVATVVEPTDTEKPAEPEPPAELEPEAAPESLNPPLEIKPYATPTVVPFCPKKK
jgi:hypothetical protein